MRYGFDQEDQLARLVQAILSEGIYQPRNIRPAHMPRTIIAAARTIGKRLAILASQPPKTVLEHLQMPATIENTMLVQQLQSHFREELKRLQKGQ